MNVGIDITSLIYQRGVSRYTANLVAALLSHTNLELSLFGSSLRKYQYLKAQADHFSQPGRTTSKVLRLPNTVLELAWKLHRLPIHTLLPECQVFHSWDWIQPPDSTLPLVSTIHDVALLKFPETAHPSILKHHKRSWETLAERQAHIIAVSNTTKKDIVDLLGYPAYLITVIPEALPEEFKTVSDAITSDQHDEIKQELELKRPYLLAVGTREPRKNLLALIEAWQSLQLDIDLLIAGEEGWDKTSKYETLPNLRFLGRVSDAQLAVLYSEAEAFVFPSLYEGFGLPILEAFHFGTPVITSKNSGMLEVAGNAAELVDPQDVGDIARGIKTVLNENTLQQKQRLQRMIIRQHMFTWQSVAQKTQDVYIQALNAN